MKYSYNFYETDASFDYGQGTCYCTDEHGFSIDIDKNNFIDITTLNAYGDYYEMEEKCKTLADLRQYLEEHIEEVQEENYVGLYTNKEIFKELIEIIKIDCGVA